VSPNDVAALRAQINSVLTLTVEEAGDRRGMLRHAIGRSRETREPLEQCHPALDPIVDVALLANGRRLLDLLAIADGSAPEHVAELEQLVQDRLDPISS
jgi:hypothetical protein